MILFVASQCRRENRWMLLCKKSKLQFPLKNSSLLFRRRMLSGAVNLGIVSGVISVLNSFKLLVKLYSNSLDGPGKDFYYVPLCLIMGCWSFNVLSFTGVNILLGVEDADRFCSTSAVTFIHFLVGVCFESFKILHELVAFLVTQDLVCDQTSCKIVPNLVCQE